MNRPDHPYGKDASSTRVGRDTTPTGTSTGADVTGRMTGTDRTGDGRHDRVEHHDRDHDRHERVEHHDRHETRGYVGKLKTSAAAVFALVFGLAALFCALTAILAPAAVLFGIIGLILAVAAFKMTRRPGVTGKGVAIGGLVTALLGLLLGAGVLAGAAVFVNDEQRLDQLQGWIDDARSELPSGNDVVEEIPGN